MEHGTSGVPEDSIGEKAKSLKPQIIVMGTRGSGKKEKELIGSVTCEVLDSCHFPVFAVPESANIFEINELRHILFFCNNDTLHIDRVFLYGEILEGSVLQKLKNIP